MLAAFHRKHDGAVFIHDVNRAESPAIDFQGFTMLLRGVPIADVKRVGFYNVAVGNTLLERLHHITGQNIRTVAFAGV